MDSLDRPRKILAAGIAGLAGYVDANGFLSADRYFVSFMSGNTTRLGTDLVTSGIKAAIPALLICGFVVGVAMGSVVAFRAGIWRKPAVLGFVTLLLAAGSAFALKHHVAPMMACLVFAMGALNNTMQRGEVPVALTYLTGALVRIGQGLGGHIGGRRTEGVGGYVVLWLSLSSGAAAGALVFQHLGPKALLVALTAALILTLAGWRIAAANAPA